MRMGWAKSESHIITTIISIFSFIIAYNKGVRFDRS